MLYDRYLLVHRPTKIHSMWPQGLGPRSLRRDSGKAYHETLVHHVELLTYRCLGEEKKLNEFNKMSADERTD